MGCVVLVLAGCGGGSGDDSAGSAVENGDAGGSAQGDGEENGSGDTGDQFGGSADLGDLTIPAPGGGAVAEIESSEQISAYLITYPGDRLDELIDYYDKWTGDEADGYERREGTTGDITWQLAQPGLSRIIVVLAPVDGNDLVTVTVTESTEGS